MTVKSDLLPGSKSYSPITYEQAPEITDDTIDALAEMEMVCNRIARSKEPSPEDLELYDRYRTAVQYEMRKGRFIMFRRLYDIVNIMVDRLQDALERGDDGVVSPAQIRLYLSMFLDQTRAELEEKGPDTVIDQRKQTVNVIRIMGEDSKLIDVDRNDGHR